MKYNTSKNKTKIQLLIHLFAVAQSLVNNNGRKMRENVAYRDAPAS